MFEGRLKSIAGLERLPGHFPYEIDLKKKPINRCTKCETTASPCPVRQLS